MDKQYVSPSPKKRRTHAVQPPDYHIYPCLSDYLAPDVVGGALNTVFPLKDSTAPGKWPLCPFVQLTPAINQNARINGSFLIQDTIDKESTFSPWREATDYENPIFGWVIINYADNGLQFFRYNGEFYCEIRKGGVASTTASASTYLPFPKPDLLATDAATAQLSQFLANLSPKKDPNGSYFQAILDMINGSIINMPFPPSSYSAYANSLVGKPLCLVNVGWSLELAEPACRPEYTLRPNSLPDPQKYLSSYSFPLKIGDIERSFDGVVGFFEASNPGSASELQSTHFDTLYTYFNPTPHPSVKTIAPNTICLSPYYIDPEPWATPDMLIARERQYTVTSILMDPYTPIHGYSPILPTKKLQLAPWTVEEAMKSMHAFIHMGPISIVNDVPKTLAQVQSDTVIPLPLSGAKGTWTWLQPYAEAVPTIAPTSGGTVTGASTVGNPTPQPSTSEQDDTKFATIAVTQDAGSVNYAKGPYTFIEGYLQLMGTLAAK